MARFVPYTGIIQQEIMTYIIFGTGHWVLGVFYFNMPISKSAIPAGVLKLGVWSWEIRKSVIWV